MTDPRAGDPEVLLGALSWQLGPEFAAYRPSTVLSIARARMLAGRIRSYDSYLVRLQTDELERRSLRTSLGVAIAGGPGRSLHPWLRGGCTPIATFLR
jgi:hypothetical protein